MSTMESSAAVFVDSQALSPSNILFEETVEDKSSPENRTKVALGEVGTAAKKGRTPRRLIHFSDGVLEEYSTDEEDEKEEPDGPSIDPRSLRWLPWVWYYIVSMSFGALSVADTCGEKLAWFFGITSPKYQYAIDEFERIQTEEKEEDAMLEREKQAEKERETQRLANMEDAVTSAYSPPSEGGQVSTSGTLNPAYQPDALAGTEKGDAGEGDRF